MILDIRVATEDEALRLVSQGFWMRPGNAYHCYLNHYGKSKKFVVVEGDKITEDATLSMAATAKMIPVSNESLLVLSHVCGVPGFPYEAPDLLKFCGNEVYGPTGSMVLAWREHQKINERQFITLKEKWLCAVLDWEALLDHDAPKHLGKELAAARDAEIARRA